MNTLELLSKTAQWKVYFSEAEVNALWEIGTSAWGEQDDRTIPEYPWFMSPTAGTRIVKGYKILEDDDGKEIGVGEAVIIKAGFGHWLIYRNSKQAVTIFGLDIDHAITTLLDFLYYELDRADSIRQLAKRLSECRHMESNYEQDLAELVDFWLTNLRQRTRHWFD